MTPKEQARVLINKYWDLVNGLAPNATDNLDHRSGLKLERAKQCALIAVEEQQRYIASLPISDTLVRAITKELNEVKDEIIKFKQPKK